MIKVSSINDQIKASNRVIVGYPVVLSRGYEYNPAQSLEENLERLEAEATAKGKKTSAASIMFESSEVSLGQGFNFGTKRKIHFENGTPNGLVQVCQALKLKENSALGQYRIVVIEKTTQDAEGQPHKIYPEGHSRAGEPVVTPDGALIYRSTKLVAVNSPDQDVLLEINRSMPDTGEGIEVPANGLAIEP